MRAVERGEVVAQGTLKQIEKAKNSLTADYLTGRRAIAVPAKRRKGNGHQLTVHGARANNLKDVTVRDSFFTPRPLRKVLREGFLSPTRQNCLCIKSTVATMRRLEWNSVMVRRVISMPVTFMAMVAKALWCGKSLAS